MAGEVRPKPGKHGVTAAKEKNFKERVVSRVDCYRFLSLLLLNKDLA